MFNYEVIADFSVLILVQIKGIFYPKKIKEIGCPNKYWTLINERQKKNRESLFTFLFQAVQISLQFDDFFLAKNFKILISQIVEIFSKNLLEHPVGIHFVRNLHLDLKNSGNCEIKECRNFNVLLYKIPDETSYNLPKIQIWQFSG